MLCCIYVCAAIRNKATLLMTTLRSVEQPFLARSPVDRPHSMAELTAGVTHCFVPELMSCCLVRTAVQPRAHPLFDRSHLHPVGCHATLLIE